MRLTRAGQLELIRVRDESVTVLASAPMELKYETRIDVSFTVAGDELRAEVAGKTLRVRDETPLALHDGGIGFIAAGADLAIYSGHKFLGGPTSGIIAGNRDLVRAAYLQNIGIGRGMKIGKESIAGAIAALRQWQKRDHAGIRTAERAALALWRETLLAVSGIEPVIVSDPAGNPLERLQVNVDPTRFGASAAALARALGEQDPAVIVRNGEAELGYIQLDPCNLKPGQAALVAEILTNVCRNASAIETRDSDADAARNGGVDAYLRWLAPG